MFETTVVESRVAHGSRTRAMSFPVSVGLHAAIIGTAILANAWSVAMPKASPPQIKPFIMKVLPTVPAPVRPAPPRQPEPQQPASVSRPAAGPVVDAPPAQIPSDIPNLTPGDATGPIEGPVQWNWTGTGDTGSGVGDGIVTEPTGPYPVVAGGATKPITIRRVEPVYPPILVRAKMTGYAIVECIVERDGRITSAEVVETNHPLFGEAARDAVLQWKFLPGRLNGDPVPTIFSLTVNFEVRR